MLLLASAALPRGARALELGLKVPFSPRDVLPILPRQVAWPVMNTLHSAVDLLPSFVAAVAPGAPSPAAWTGACFAVNEAAIELTPGDRNGTDVGGAVLRLKVFAPRPLVSPSGNSVWIGFVEIGRSCFSPLRNQSGEAYE
jgi:hypothetical protein